MTCRGDSCDKGGVAGIGDGGNDAVDTSGIGAFTQESAQVGNLQTVSIGFQDIIGAQTIDRNENDRSMRRLVLSRNNGRKTGKQDSGEQYDRGDRGREDSKWMNESKHPMARKQGYCIGRRHGATDFAHGHYPQRIGLVFGDSILTACPSLPASGPTNNNYVSPQIAK